MIIRSIRLKNVKSYGEGAEGGGITVSFQPGVNRVAGRNGHGKTTLIEALGFALFFAEPDFEERFTLPTYFVRTGEKEGEIDVSFEHDKRIYRIERGIGQSKRRTKVIRVEDDSTCAEGDEAVAAWLCSLLGFKQRRQLCDLFTNLIGVKQGRLIWPFDSKPAAAKEFFEPLLDVAIFRQSADFLSDAQGRFKDLLVDQQRLLEGVLVRINERSESVRKVPALESLVETWEKAVEKSRKQKDDADRLKQAWDQKQDTFTTARAALDEAKHAVSLAAVKRETDQEWVNKSQEAVAVATKATPGYAACLKAEERLRALHERQSEKSALQQKRAETSNALTKAQEQKQSAENQLKGIAAQREEIAKRAETLRGQLSEGSDTLRTLQSGCARLSELALAAKRSKEIFSGWLNSRANTVEENEKILRDALGNADIEALLTSFADERHLEEATRDWSRKLARTEQAKISLASQLAEINGGVCPFLREKCLQFKPEKVQSDLVALEKDHAEISARHQESGAKQEDARRKLQNVISTVSKKLSDRFDEQHSNFQKCELQRVAQERDLDNKKKQLEQVERELIEISSRVDALSADSTRADGAARNAAAQLLEWDEKLKGFSTLEEEIREQHRTKDKHAQEHRLYLENQPLAAKVDSLRDALAKSRDAETRAQEQVRLKTAAFEAANKDFDLNALENARNAVASAATKVRTDEKDLLDAQKQLKQEKERLREWKEACKQRDEIEGESSRLQASIEIARVGGRVLKNAAPAVADRICQSIAGNAQKIFNQISQETIKLEWKAEPQYSLRVVPGERRFAMLSGGEQTKLALAMTLAMIQEFSGLRFAVFDEPTYAVDADSRQKLADAILEAQKAAGLEQLIVVSHDDAFEGKIEHVVMVRKTAAGTETVAQA